MSDGDYSDMQMGSINHDNLDYMEPAKDETKKPHDWFKHIYNTGDHM